MGMFDNFAIDNKWLPENSRKPYDEQDFQTKSLDCELKLFEVLEDGSLILSDPFNDEGEIIKPVNYTGEIRFYDDYDCFVAWCVNGRVKEVIQISGRL